MEINIDRLAKVTTIHHGAHREGEKMCAMEAVAFVAGEPWSDTPQCASPVIGAFMRSWNDILPDNERTALLLPLITRLIGTVGSAELEQRRATMAADWLISVYTPAWLRLAKLDPAEALERLTEITDFAQCPGLMPTLNAARNDSAAAWDAARAAARARLSETKDELKKSAVQLVIRMCDARDEE